MKEGDFHRLTPVEMTILRSEIRCVKCNALHGKCDCWTECSCGWKYASGKSCSNPDCAINPHYKP